MNNDATCFGQRTPEWYKARLGKITGSMVYNVMLMPTKKAQAEGEVFSETAKGYLCKVAAERNIDPYYFYDHFEEWLDRTNVETRAMRYGTETEDLARTAYAMQLEGYTVENIGFVTNEQVENYGDSPDGVVCDKDYNVVGCIEIKCPNSDTWVKYRMQFTQGKSLKDIEEKYYWQCQSHMLCLGVGWCDFVYFDKMMKDGLQIVRIERNDEDIELMTERIALANEYIDKVLLLDK